MATHLLVGNPTAQSGKNKERIERALEIMKEAGIAADLLPTLPGGKTIAAVREALDELGEAREHRGLAAAERQLEHPHPKSESIFRNESTSSKDQELFASIGR